MNNAKKRIISGLVVFGCVMAAVGAAAGLSKNADNDAVPAALTSGLDDTPVIILDAGHGG
ncbi:MAG: hypothetical protein IJ874_07140 [Ruminococcus sp.]|nr:hypothetical protein [Ruminococcus sp.]